MNKQLADNLQKSLNISQEQIVREEYEMIILKQLFESELGRLFVFKGGTALRLAYGSPRFSEDLDFSVLEDFSKEKLDRLLRGIASQNDALKIMDLTQKYYTYFGLFRIKEGFMDQAFSIKFEASIRPVNLKKDIDYNLLALNSRVTNLTVLAQVESLQQIKKEKKKINPLRIRDVFDLWFIGQKLGESVTMDFSQWKNEEIRRELFKFLPEKEKRLVEQWLSKK
ncbi:MAG: nucleotidyl transferase AbiEii/AbiGii toxin family protein [Actinobacteria bacterium]|nr:nucleotidyl transferase AbiEii/AbiGii toxin family protein [Cyanobacteriota bacterium]MCL5771188.1 nucleotidyl transferase AbiEii/AbiGii toxin family protein [Actinomycetota bacterium]